jgi:hypothetical protein
LADNRVEIRDYLQIVTYIVTVPSVLVGLAKYFKEKRRDQRNREREAFETTNKRYADFLEVCLQQDPSMFDLAPELGALGFDLKKGVLIADALTMIETAYVWYQQERTEELEDQWQAWQRYVDVWLRREDFLKVWPTLRTLYHNKFIDYVNERLKAKSAGADPAGHSGASPSV